TTGALEAAYAQAYEKSVSLFKQQLVDCAGDFNNFGFDGVCKYSSENAAIRVLETINIIMGAEDELKHAVGVVRPVSVVYQVSGDFKQYTGGVYTNNSCVIDPMLDMVKKTVSHTGSLRTHRERIGVWEVTIKSRWAKTCVIPLYAGHSVEIISMKENTSYEIVPQKEEEKEGLRVGNKENTSFTQTAAGPIELVKLLIQNQDEMIKAASIEDDGKKPWKHHRTKASTENS
nr:thiol protease aleurain-like [Tanacetum cinerariifolium]